MRRPAPLPASADEPEGDRPARRGRRAVVADPPEAVVGDRDAVATPPAGGAADTAPVDVQVVEVKDVERELSSVDVWRAARARRKALRAEIRRFTQRSRRRRMLWWGTLGAVLALVVGSVVAAYSPLFAVEKITVAGAESLDPAAVEQALGAQLGTPLALVDASEVKSALVAFPIIESYALEARPPHELLVRIVERTPIGVIRSDAGFSLVDAAGVVLATTEQAPEGQPLLEISGGRDSAAFRSAGMVVRTLPADLRATVVGVRATSADDVTLSLQGDRTVIWGSAENSVKKATALVKVMAAAPDARTFDVSSPSVAVVG
ncbi:FtsQ-type POTRA domain-containing protein [Microbacterium sp.]|uniref:FtsQ-type POTRA domain-containing protein n=1 Tax=Microbacterium sp. TaxID=51671 RepID=UPI002810E766|nr:FtsQ-type POTRA domain-containing protein [Microbacterium sp.]